MKRFALAFLAVTFACGFVHVVPARAVSLRSQNCAHGCGTVFSVDIQTGAEKVIHSFQRNGMDGFFPSSAVTIVGGTLYGTTQAGGAHREGTVFSIDLNSGAETIIHSFTKRGAEGIIPAAGLTELGGLLYGTTYFGGGGPCGNAGCGAVFSIDPASGKIALLHSFQGYGSDGSLPRDTLLSMGGMLYGTTFGGGVGQPCSGIGCGTVFVIDPSTGSENVLYSFQGGNDGASPFAGLTDVSGTLYGTTGGGGSFNGGTVFSVDPATGAEKVLYSFGINSGDGYEPVGGLTEVDGLLYGTTCEGGQGGGTVFSVDPTSGTEAVLYALQNSDGACPEAGLVDVSGTLYGTTAFGGAGYSGTVFSISTAGIFKTVFAFHRKYGREAEADLDFQDGTIYGTTYRGGRRE